MTYNYNVRYNVRVYYYLEGADVRGHYIDLILQLY